MLSKKEILKRLKVLREEKRLRQGHLARRLGIDRSTFTKKENGTVPIAMGEGMEYFFTAASTNIELRERLLLKFYRSLNHTEQRDLLRTIRLILKGMRRKRVHDTLNRLVGLYNG
jgi:transcriptional regulator with XRE-family HTH domain